MPPPPLQPDHPAAPHILCLGGGYVAIYLAKALRRHIRAGRVRLTVVDQDNFQCFHGLIPDMITGKIQPTDTLSPARRLFAPGDFVNAEVESIDIDKKEVIVARYLDGRRLTLRGDHLVFALGSTEHLGRFPGLAEHSFRLKAYTGCLAVRNHFLSMLELADMERDPVERRRLLTFVVVGGNYAGVEVAGELREFLPAVARRHFPNIPPAEIKVLLVCSTGHILPELGARMPKLIEYAERKLAADPYLEIHYNTRLASATREEAILGDGRRIPTRTIVSCTGMSTIPVLEKPAAGKKTPTAAWWPTASPASAAATTSGPAVIAPPSPCPTAPRPPPSRSGP
jgi:NADH:ubiquinone reductase (H+-translocating)